MLKNCTLNSYMFSCSICFFVISPSSSSESLPLQETYLPISFLPDYFINKSPMFSPWDSSQQEGCSPHPKPWDHHRQNPHKSPSIPPKFPAQTSICKAHRSNSPKTQLGPRQMDLRSWVVYFWHPVIDILAWWLSQIEIEKIWSSQCRDPIQPNGYNNWT